METSELVNNNNNNIYVEEKEARTVVNEKDQDYEQNSVVKSDQVPGEYFSPRWFSS